MKAGDPWDCPHCKKNSFLKKEPVHEGWKKVGEVLKCVACDAVVEEIDTPAENKVNALAALLGVEVPTSATVLSDDADRRFCRDCKHRVMNAFRIYCTKHERDVNPMDDCPDFLSRENNEKEG